MVLVVMIVSLSRNVNWEVHWLVLAWRFRFKVHSNAFMSNMIYVKKPIIELIIFMSVGGTVSANRNVSYVSTTRVCAR
jgi:hypothetical protein